MGTNIVLGDVKVLWDQDTGLVAGYVDRNGDEQPVLGSSAAIAAAALAGIEASATLMATFAQAIIDSGVVVDAADLAKISTANTLLAQLIVNQGEITTSKPFSVKQTWNGSGVAFNALTVEVTDTASDAAGGDGSGNHAWLIKAMRGGVMNFGVDKYGSVWGASFNPGGGDFGHVSAACTNYAAAQTATMTNGPTAGNPTKWLRFNDNGTNRYIPAW